MNTKQTKALKLALEALEVATTPLAKDRQEVLRAQAAIREALASKSEALMSVPDGAEQPAQQREQRKPLTDEQINAFFQGMEPNNGFWLSFARAIEAAHGIGEKPDVA